MNTLNLIFDFLVPVLTALIGWLAGRRKQRNDFLAEMQASIDLLSAKNAELIKEVLNLNEKVVQLQKENVKLRAEVEELNEKLSNVKTITKKI